MKECLMISSIQKIVIYETFSHMYIIGSDKKETRFRVLTVERTHPYNLILHDDKKIYSQGEIKVLLKMIANENYVNIASLRNSAANSLSVTVSAYGIVGFVKFLSGYYIILITKRRLVAIIGPHTIYKIEDTCLLHIPNDEVSNIHSDETRYEKMFQNVDLSSNFYFSYSYDLTHNIQYNMAPTVCQHRKDNGKCQESQTLGVCNKPCYKFVWNKYLLEKCEKTIHHDWLLYITHGFLYQSNISVFGKSLYLTLIARRSNQYAGARFLKRGANSRGSVANEVETEQIVFDASLTELHFGRVTSFVQTRGSVPLFWSQDVSTIVPKPPITLDQIDPYCEAPSRHFSEYLSHYGAPVIILNLVKRREGKRHESILSDWFKEQCIYLNQFLPSEHHIVHIAFDMARYSKRKNSDIFSKLDQIALKGIQQTGMFFYSRKPVHPEFWDDPRLTGLKGFKTVNGCRQTGVIRTNCVDCLDRTNTAQFAIGKCALGFQLYLLGVIGKPHLLFDTDCIRMLEDLYEDQGDTLALQYGGSYLVHRLQTYRKTSPFTAHSRDIMTTLSRYYSNAFSDAEKQQSINVFLGLYKPSLNKINIWDLATDFYLHNPEAAGSRPSSNKCYTQWFDRDILHSLPLPHNEEVKDECDQIAVLKGDSSKEQTLDTFTEFYLPHELTVLEERFTHSMMSSTRDYMPKSTSNFSPFSPRIRAATQIQSNETSLDGVRGTDDNKHCGLNCSESSTESEASSRRENIESSHSSDDISLIKEMVPSPSAKTPLCNLPSSLDSYNFEIHSASRHATSLYQRYVKKDNISRVIEEDPHKVKDEFELSPISVFRLDSSFAVELPALGKYTRQVYESYVEQGRTGHMYTREGDTALYRQYCSFLYS